MNGIDLLLQELDISREREDVLDRPVVEVEAEAREPPLGRRGERLLAARRVAEQVLALDDRAQLGCRLEQVGVRDGLLGRADAPDDGGVRLAEAEHGRRSELRAAEQRETRPLAQRRLRLRARAPARTALAAEGDHAVEPARSSSPERHVAEHVQPQQEPELELDRQERRELEQARVPDDLAEEDVARGGQRQRAGLGDRRARAAHVGLVELERRAQLDDRGRRVPDRCEAVADLVVGIARVDTARVGEDRRENRPELVRAAFQEVRVEPLEALLGPAVRVTFGQGTGRGAVPPEPMCVPASVIYELPPHLREFPHEFKIPAPPAHSSPPR